jgi:hypothetical protein
MSDIGYGVAGARLPADRNDHRRANAMQLEDMILMSVDDHICEPADMFEKHISPKFKDRAPKIVRSKSGVEAWEIADGRSRPQDQQERAQWPSPLPLRSDVRKPRSPPPTSDGPPPGTGEGWTGR